MKNLKLKKNKLIRLTFFKEEITLKVVKSLCLSFKFHFKEMFFFFNKFNSRFTLGSSKIHINNICILTGRFSGVNRLFKVSRIKIRDCMLQKYLIGLRKSSW